ncbi:MSMEG_0567/sll0787 family protein [Cryptosporangium phraense]|uniref:AIR synthase n=1 Tax=Cryptosporangium phraense TaxID=2593070 RepID=A0A545AJU3_9ACTN|nr:MSMEG_0567/sll0787 family protein [Cryptosporangium phraense]TQS41583.1 AIR synthase [Cryptosporangium phraense]
MSLIDDVRRTTVGGEVRPPLDVPSLTGGRRPAFTIERASDLGAYHALRRQAFVEEQGLFAGSDLDDRDDDPRTVVLVARDRSGAVIGGVRVGPATDGPDIGWWTGSRLAVAPGWRATGHLPGRRGSGAPRGGIGVGPALVRAACAYAENAGVLRFEATVQAHAVGMFRRLGWERVRDVRVAGRPHELVRWPIGRIAALVAATKRDLGALLDGLAPGGAGWIGDDGAPVPGSDLIAACDAILPSMVERDPEWAGWCGVLVNVNDLSAMGATPVGVLDALGARDRAQAARVLSGVRAAASAYGVPILGGHTQLGVPGALAITALGHATAPVPGSGQRGQEVRLTVDLGGGWRPGYTGRQWDSTSGRSGEELRALGAFVRETRPAAAKDVSMAGIAGTLGMLAEASGCRAVLDVNAVPRPAGATMGDWLTCFPGFGMLTTNSPAGRAPAAGPATSAICGALEAGSGVALRWPDGELTDVITAGVTGLGPSRGDI